MIQYNCYLAVENESPDILMQGIDRNWSSDSTVHKRGHRINVVH